MEHQVGGKTAEEIFVSPQLRALAKAGCEGDSAKIQTLVSQSVPVDGAGAEGVTPLLWALSCKNVSGVKALLEAGADPNKKAVQGMTAVLAAVNYYGPFLSLMLDHGGDPNAVYNDSQRTALEEALSHGIHTSEWDNFELLVQRGADINRAPEKGLPIAEAAIARGRPSKALFLLDHGYRHDLDGLANVLHGSLLDKSSKEYQERDKVIARLEALGVNYAHIAKTIDDRRASQGMAPLEQY